ncbi:MAG: FtsX-like permease family protein [Gemmatimonadota bacterium]
MKSDIATQHRAAGIGALAFAAATITALAGVFVLDVRSARVAAGFELDVLPDPTWQAEWLPGAVTAAQQQQAALEQWLHLVLIFAAITAAVACINALIGFVSYANERRYETALRGVVGASPKQLRRALLLQSSTNALLGAALGVAAGVALATVLRRLWQTQSATDVAWPLLAFSVCLALASFAARITARRFTRSGWLGDALAPEARSVPGFGAEDLRALLTAAQLTCAVALTTVSLLVWSYASARTHGTIAQPDRYVAQIEGGSYKVVRAALRASGIEAESIASPGALLGIGKIDKIVSDCGRCSRANMLVPLFPVETQHHVVGPRFFQIAGIPVNRGREFEDGEPDERAVVVNRSFAREAFQQHDPIGKRILVGGFERAEWYHVIGVVADVRTTGLQLLAPEPGAASVASLPRRPPAIYFSANAHPPTEFDVIVRSSTPVVLAGFSFAPLARVLARANDQQKSLARVLTLLGVLLCGAAVLGSFTTTLLGVRARRMEIAVRRALGAKRGDVRRLVFARVAVIALRGIGAGLIVSVALSRAVEPYVPGLRAFDARIALAVALAFFVIALVAALLPLRLALRIAPAQAHD